SSAEYRVLVEVRNNNQKAQVRSRYPEAFTTLYRGKSMLQVGAFSNRSNAETISRSLADLGLKSYVIDF
ncbi:MAG: SPOR domain-containing protein, partial [Xenococcaceae cyanobacterium MO_234.B1]|nr:SPOR domain-containing protein [Xenococcaceae cyanobacterium MO_234.B1]